MAFTPSARQARWVDYVRTNVVGNLGGSAAERARTAAVVTWWALKEGIFDLANPLRHNLCSAAGETQIGDLGVCPSGAWQIGLSGIQGNAVSEQQVLSVADQLYPSTSTPSLLRRIARDAGVDANTVEQIASSTGALRKAWLLRDGAISFTLQRPFVERCLQSGAPSWCYGSWDTARAYASSDARVREVIAALEATYATQAIASRVLPALAILAGVAIAGYGYFETYGWPKWLSDLRPDT